MESDADKPDWWLDNERLRERMDLSPYQPPRFLDDVYIHEVVDRLERNHGIEILLLGRNTRYGDDWEVTVDGDSVASIGQHRDKNSNTVYEMESEEFREVVEESL